MASKKPKCLKCWDKGWSSELVRETSRKQDKVYIRKNYCACARGKKFKEESDGK